MPLNIPGILVTFQLILNPRLALPSVAVTGESSLEYSEIAIFITDSTQQDIRHLNFAALRKAGYKGAIFDKDNCITIPHKDELVPEIQDAWDECRRTFGEGNVLIVSNSAGTRNDPGQIQCESVSYHTRVPVLRHKAMKPAYSCINSIHDYFSSLRNPIKPNELIVVGDRIFTDVVMANRMQQKASSATIEKSSPSQTGPLAVWTTGVWKKEGMVMRWLEKKLVDVVRHWHPVTEEDEARTRRFVRRDL